MYIYIKQNTMAIIDLYNDSKLKEKDANKQRTDVITNKMFGTEAVNGFTPNLLPGDKDKTDFNMIDTKTNSTVKAFEPLNLNGGKYAPYTPSKTYESVTTRK
jgi:hypothetical protein